MNKLILFISLISFGFTKSQEKHNAATVGDFTHISYLKWTYPWLENFTETKKLKQLTFTEVLKGKHEDAFYFNEKGLVTKAVYRTNKAYLHMYAYDAKNNLVETKHFNPKNKLMYSQSWTYYSSKQFSSVKSSNKGRPEQETIYTYNKDSALIKNENFYFKKGVKKLRSYYLYSYNEEKKLASTKFYKKDKLKYTWNYSCDERGKIAKKDTTTICTSEGHDDKGRKIVTKYNTGSKKEVTKRVSYYRQSKGEDVLSEYRMYSMEKGVEVLRYSVHEPDSMEAYRSFKVYNRKGNLVHQEIIVYSVYSSTRKLIKNKESRYFDKAGKSTYARTESFDDRGLPNFCLQTGKNNKEYGKLEYIFSKDTDFTINHYKKSKLKKVYKASVSYY